MTEIARFLPVAGTHGWRGQQTGCWWQAESPWLTYMAGRGMVPYNPRRPFLWSTRLDGIGWQFWKWGRGDHREWYLAADNLYAYMVPPAYGGSPNGIEVPPLETRIVAHSHGGQVALYAASLGLRIRTLVTVATPVRDDMRVVVERARPNIGHWLHIHSDGSDWTQILGAIGDGKIDLQRSMPAADRNVCIPKAGHSGVLEEPAWFDAWAGEGWLEDLRG